MDSKYPPGLFEKNQYQTQLAAARTTVVKAIHTAQEEAKRNYVYFNMEDWSPNVVGAVTAELESLTKHMTDGFFYRASTLDQWTPVPVGGMANHMLFFKLRIFKD